MNLRIYRIKGKTNGINRLVKASSQAQGLSHVSKSEYDITVASAMEVADLITSGVTVEDASPTTAETQGE